MSEGVRPEDAAAPATGAGGFLAALARRPRDEAAGWATLALLALAPLAVQAAGAPFLLDLLTRLVILGIAAVSLNFILGYGGMISFGHAAFIGIGAYAVGICAHYERYEAWLHFPLAVFGGALFALLTGAISLRLRGVHFIMITMAFAQMAFFALVSIEEYGGDDGLVIYERSDFSFLQAVGVRFDVDDATTLFYFSFVCLLAALALVRMWARSRFGMVIQGARSNPRRMAALGFPVYRYQLAAYVMAGAMCAFAGALLGNFTTFISPEMMDWTRSGELIFMVVLGGAARLYGPLFGVALFVLLEQYLETMIRAVQGFAEAQLAIEVGKDLGVYWHFPFGLMLVLVVLFARGGVSGLLRREGGR
ncbi:MAG: branched-chain amino acid ABC transporter permease [Pseudomonadota bacterium]